MDSIRQLLGFKAEVAGQPSVGRSPSSGEVKKASSEIRKVISQCMESLKAAGTTHAQLLVGNVGDFSQLTNALDAKAMYGAYDGAKVQQLEKTQVQMKIWSSDETRELLSAKASVYVQLGVAHRKGADLTVFCWAYRKPYLAFT